MFEPKITPGPWTTNHRHVFGKVPENDPCGGESVNVCQIFEVRFETLRTENTRAIAAIPELLDVFLAAVALKNVEECYKYPKDGKLKEVSKKTCLLALYHLIDKLEERHGENK